jgi:hypothetical protein
VTRIVEAISRKFPNDASPKYHHFRILCGRETGPERFDCGSLGSIVDITWPIGVDLLSRRGSIYGSQGMTDHPTLGLVDLTIGLRGLETAHVAAVTLLPWSSYDSTPPPQQRIWVAYHERGYRERPDGAFEVMERKSHRRNPQLFIGNRAAGRHPMPDELQERVARMAPRRAGSGYELPPEGYGVFGARPALPAVIQCPDCGTPNRVRPLDFDEQRGIWYTVRTE